MLGLLGLLCLEIGLGLGKLLRCVLLGSHAGLPREPWPRRLLCHPRTGGDWHLSLHGTTEDEGDEATEASRPAKRPRTTAGGKKRSAASVAQIGGFSVLEFAR